MPLANSAKSVAKRRHLFGPIPRRAPAPAQGPSSAESAQARERALERLVAEDGNLVTWHRPLPAGAGEHLARWVERYPARLDQLVDLPGGVGTAAEQDLASATLGLAEPTRAWITRDVLTLLGRFAHVTDSRRLRVFFGAVRTDQCRKFHVDYVRFRMITTYLGPGTEWLPDEAVRREVLEHPPSCPCDANKAIAKDPAAIRHAALGEVLVMKGARHPCGRGLVHRSPPIEGTGASRVVLIASTT